MPFAFSRIEPRTADVVVEPSINTSQFYRMSLEQGGHDSILGSVQRIAEYDAAARGKMIDPDEATRKYGLPGLTFDSPIFEEQASLRHKRKQAEIQREMLISSGSSSGWRMAGGLGAQMLGSMSNIIDMGINFIPIVGAESVVAKVGAKGLPLLSRIAARRGLISAERVAAIPILGKFPKVTSSIIEGVAGQSIAEIPLAIANLQDQSRYGASDAALNIIGAGVLAGTLRTALSGAARLWGRLSLPTREAAFNDAVNSVANNRAIDIERFIRTEESVIKYDLQLKDLAARRAAAAGEVDAKTSEIKRSILNDIRSRPERAVNRENLIEIAYAELESAKEVSFKHEMVRKDGKFVREDGLPPEMLDFEVLLERIERLRAKVKKPNAKTIAIVDGAEFKIEGRRYPETVAGNRKALDHSLDELAAMMELHYDPSVKNFPEVYHGPVSRNKGDFSLSEHVTPENSNNIVQASARARMEAAGDSQFHQRVGLEKARRMESAMKSLSKQEDEVVKAKAESQKFLDDTAPPDSTARFATEDMEASEAVYLDHAETLKQSLELTGERVNIEIDNPAQREKIAKAASDCLLQNAI